MKKIFVSTGLAAIGLAGMQSVYGQGLDIVSPKAWSIGGTLRGFYDDNYNITSTRRGSVGGELSPTISVNVPTRQTDMGIRYTYVLYYYNDRDQLPGVNPFDQNHQLDVWLNHAINERWKINFNDTFSYGRSPELINPTSAAVLRTQSDNLANHASLSLDTQWTKLFGTSLHYGNDFYSFMNSGATVGADPAGSAQGSSFPIGTPGGAGFSKFTSPSSFVGGASLAGLLDRVEQNVGLDFNWTLSPETKLMAGVDFAQANYIGNEPIAIFNYFDTTHPTLPPGNTIGSRSLIYMSNARDSRSYEGHVGATHDLTANIHLDFTLGAVYTDSYNDPLNHATTISPTANVSINYTYSPGSYVQMSVAQGHNATDVVQPGSNGDITQYQDTTTFSADWNHKINEKLIGTLIAQYMYSTFQGGNTPSGGDSQIAAGLNLTYQINRHFSADLGYNFDDLLSGLQNRGFVRNRVYMGLTASY